MHLKFLFQQTGKLVSYYIMEMRSSYWNLIASKKKTVNLRIFPSHDIKIEAKGDVARIIYQGEPMLRYKRSFEYSTFELFSNHLNPGNVIIDIGANIGVHSIFFSKLVGKNGQVFSFEPEGKTFLLLQQNLQLNNCENVHISNIALSNKNGFVELCGHESGFSDADGGDPYKFIKQMADENKGDTVGLVKSVRLNDIPEINSLDKIDFIKIDVEGAELLVFEGAKQIILKYKPVIIFELEGAYTKRFNYKPYQVFVLLNELGYEMEEYEKGQWKANPQN